MNTNKYQLILDYNMTMLEAQAFKIALIWEDLTAKHFPYHKGILKLAKGDPRKSNLFRHCWKLLRETRGLLQENEYKLYIEANIQVVKIYGGNVTPSMLCGDKAWIRWKIWKRMYDKKLLEMNGKEPPKIEADPKIIKELDKTKRFIFEKCDGEPTFEKIESFFDDQLFRLWLMAGHISYYWLLMSPWMSKISSVHFLEKNLSFDSKVYFEKINDSLKQFFADEFKHEFQ